MDIRLIIKGTGVLFGLYLVQVLLVTAHANFSRSDSALLGLNLLLGLLISLAAGFYVGRKVRGHAFMHGFNVGAAGTVLISSILFAFFGGALPLAQ